MRVMWLKRAVATLAVVVFANAFGYGMACSTEASAPAALHR